MSFDNYNAFIYENLKKLYSIKDGVDLCIYGPTKKLYIVKETDKSQIKHYEKTAKLKCKHLAQVLYITQKDEKAFIMREYISGDMLSDLIKRNKIDTQTALDIAKAVCDGVGYMHREGIVHRDITPNNIIITQSSCPVIIDCGIMRSFTEDKGSDTLILGTPGYAAPEQFGFTQSDDRTDIYAIGVLLNVMLTKKLPHEEIAKGDVGKIIKRCTAIDAKKRYKDINALKKALTKAKSEATKPAIPGFRTAKKPVTLLAVILYAVAVAFCVIVFSVTMSRGQIFLVPLAELFFLLLVPYVCLGNLFDIQNRLPFSENEKKSKLIYTIIALISVFVAFVIIGNNPLQ